MADFATSIDITSGGTYKLDIVNGESSAQVASDLNGKMNNLQTILQAKLPETCTASALPTTLQHGKLIIWNNQLYFGNSSNQPTTVTPTTVPSHSHSATDITSGTLSIERGGTGNTTGLAASATKLETSRSIRVNLASTSYGHFDGTSDITPGVTGTLPANRGGTGCTSLSALASALESYLPSSSVQIVKGTFTSTSSGRSGVITIGFYPYLFIMLANSNADNTTGRDMLQLHDRSSYIGACSTQGGISLGSSKLTMDGISQAGSLINNTTYSYVAIGN